MNNLLHRTDHFEIEIAHITNIKYVGRKLSHNSGEPSSPSTIKISKFEIEIFPFQNQKLFLYGNFPNEKIYVIKFYIFQFSLAGFLGLNLLVLFTTPIQKRCNVNNTITPKRAHSANFIQSSYYYAFNRENLWTH